jgi:SAM-dependent methyltransferase
VITVRCPSGLGPGDATTLPATIAGIPAYAPELAHDHGGFASDGHEILAGVEDRHFWFRCRRDLIVDLLARHAPAIGSFCEVGCGNGYVLQAIAAARPELHLCGIDASIAGLLRARTRVPGADVIQADATRLPANLRFDAIGAFDMLEHVDDDVAVLRAMRGALRPGGVVLVTVPQHRWLWSWADEVACHRRRYTRRILATALARAGLQVERWSSYLVLLLPLLAASRLQKRPANYASAALPAHLDRLLDRLTRGETWLTRQGWDHRFGGSLVAIARRPS